MRNRDAENKIAAEMVENLQRVAEERGVNLSGLTYENFNFFLDDVFDDGGEIRCVRFTDIPDEYCLQFGPFESESFDHIKWIIIKRCRISRIRKLVLLNMGLSGFDSNV